MSQSPHALSLLTESVRVNSMRREQRAGRCFWIKRRRWAAEAILRGANGFFAAARAPLRAILPTGAWQQWETECFAGLHGGEGFASFAEGSRSMGAEELPGLSLTAYLDSDRLTPEMAAAAGRELRRAHGWHSPTLGALWSHGDAHAGNFVLQESPTLRARIIDFELRHLPSLSPEGRHADDVCGFLLDLVGRIAWAKWLPCAVAFLRGYGRQEIIAQVPERLVFDRLAPGARLWRKVQTGFLAPAEYERRLQALLASDFLIQETVPLVPLYLPSELVASTHSATAVPPSRCS